ncbi:MAG: hypothetical protein J3R72DRAFT_365827, partial [Linnemannia gamsii]
RRQLSRSNTGSDLEAFTRNPMDDSFGPMPAQAVPNINYPNQRFLCSRSLFLGGQSNAYRILIQYDRKTQH